LLNLAMYAATIAVLVLAEPVWLKLATAAAAAFVFTQIGYIGHDAGHRQIFARPWRNDVVGLCLGPLMGVSRSWWVANHNAHHSFPNDLDLDPHTAIPALAFSEDQARSKRGFMRGVTRFQAFYFFPMLLLQGFGIRLASVVVIASGRARYPLAEGLGMAVHFSLYFGLLFLVMQPWQAAIFVLVHQGLMGFYMGSVFAPNHKGMAIVSKDSPVDFFHRQVLTTRNVKPNFVIDYLYGGLNYQIEHHLFPNIPRNKLGEARGIVKAFCSERAIPYYETGVVRSYLEVIRYLSRVVEPLRSNQHAVTSNE
jgi:fatty acid desaturase